MATRYAYTPALHKSYQPCLWPPSALRLLLFFARHSFVISGLPFLPFPNYPLLVFRLTALLFVGLGERGCNSLALGVGVRSIDTAGKGDGKEDCILTSPGWFSATNDEWLSVVRDCVGRLFMCVCVGLCLMQPFGKSLFRRC